MRKFFIIGLLASIALVGTAQATIEFSDAINGSPVHEPPYISTDVIPVVRGEVTYKLPIASIMPMPSVKDYGAKCDGVTNDTADINAAIVAVLAAGGGSLSFPPGGCVVSQVVISITATTGFPTPRINLVGGNMYSNYLKCTGGAGACLKYTGNVVSSGIDSTLGIENLGILGVSTSNGSIGLQLNIAAYVELRNVAIEAFQTGMENNDVFSLAVYNSLFRFNAVGVTGQRVAFSEPNAFSFYGTQITNNSTAGCTFFEANSINFFGGQLAANGTGQGPSSWGCKLTDSYGGGLHVYGTYVETNSGWADFWISQSAYTSSNSFDGVYFHRQNASIYTITNILIDGTTTATANLTGTSFVDEAPYVPSSDRPSWFLSNPFGSIIDNDSNTWSDALSIPAPRMGSGRPDVQVTLSTPQAVTAGVWTKVHLNQLNYDSGFYYDSVTNFRYTPLVRGYYNVVSQISYSGTTPNGIMLCAIYKNGAAVFAAGVHVSANFMTCTALGIVYLNGSTDYIEIWGNAPATNPLFGASTTESFMQSNYVHQ